MNFKKFQELARKVILPNHHFITNEEIDSWVDCEETYQKLIPIVDPKFLEEFYIGLPSDMDRANFFSFRNCVYTQLRNNWEHGNSFWDE